MRASLFEVLAFAAAALAQTDGFDALTSPPSQAKYNIGDTLPIAWDPSAPAGKITLTLIGGPTASDLAPITVIAASIDSTLATFSWPIPSTVGSLASYGVNLTLDGGSDFQYSNQFYISGGSSSSSSSSSSSASGAESTTTLVSTTQSTATITVASSSSTPTPSGGLLSSASFPNSTITTSAVKTASKSASASTAGSGSASGSASPAPTSGAEAMRFGGVGLVGLGGAVMALLL